MHCFIHRQVACTLASYLRGSSSNSGLTDWNFLWYSSVPLSEWWASVTTVSFHVLSFDVTQSRYVKETLVNKANYLLLTIKCLTNAFINLTCYRNTKAKPLHLFRGLLLHIPPLQWYCIVIWRAIRAVSFNKGLNKNVPSESVPNTLF
jgi:hypothetical protein